MPDGRGKSRRFNARKTATEIGQLLPFKLVAGEIWPDSACRTGKSVRNEILRKYGLITPTSGVTAMRARMAHGSSPVNY
jgi:hypothetical protein